MCDKCRVFHYGVDIGLNLGEKGCFRVKHWTCGQGVFETLELPVSFFVYYKVFKIHPDVPSICSDCVFLRNQNIWL